MIKIKAIERKAGFGKTSKKLWYPAIHLHSDVQFEEFIELVSDETTVSSADVKAVFDRAAKVLIRLLQDGKSVDCGDMGTFRPSITANLTLLSMQSYRQQNYEVQGKRHPIALPLRTQLFSSRIDPP